MLSKIFEVVNFFKSLKPAMEIVAIAVLLVEAQSETDGKKGEEKKAAAIAQIEDKLPFSPEVEKAVVPMLVELVLMLLKRANF
ncbi:MAG: hypothetical protein E6R03_06585 [Hyphomicrobiaceae bacterium]|nr:MAG: hypothetical protein E6R03_06585 [Hyphomicrobiaceae bacterium]